MLLRYAFALAFTLTTSPLLAQRATLDLAQADALGQDVFRRSGSTGMVLVIVRPQETRFFSYGETAPGSHTRPTPDSFLRLCSLTKIFTTDLLTRMVADGTVRLNDPLQKFTDSHIMVPAREGRSITLEHLATHTSGLPRELGRAPQGTPHFTYPDAAQRQRWLPHQKLRSTPGTAALYSNVGFDLLGDALGTAAAKPFPSLLAERVTLPLGLTETTYTPSATQCARLLLGAHDEGPCTDTTANAGDGGLYSTAADMTRWLQYLLGTTQPAQLPAAEAVYINPNSLRSQTGLDHAGKPSGIGLGWLHLQDDAAPNSIIQKTGGGAGFATYIALNQPNHTGIFLAVTDGPVETHQHLFLMANDLLLALSNLPPLPREVPRPATKSRPHSAHRKATTPKRA